MQDNIRPIAPVSISGLTPGKPSTGLPIFEMIRPEDLFVDPAYHRNVNENGMRKIRRIIEAFD